MSYGMRALSHACRLLAFVAAISPAQAARLPDWAAALAARAPEVPSGAPGNPSRVLLSEWRYVVQPDGTYRIRRRLGVQALSVETESVSTGWHAFEETTKITATRAWHLPPGDSAKRNRSTPVDVTIGDSFLTSSRARAVPVEGVKKGSLLFFEFEATEKPYFLNLTHHFFEGSLVVLARLSVETPPGWTVRTWWIRGKGPEPILEGATRTWEMRDLPAPVEEELAPSPLGSAPLLGINLVPPAGTNVAPAVFSDWAAVSSWYDSLSKDRRAVTPAVEAARKTLTVGDPALTDRILAAATMVRDRVRYVAVELGIGGFQPRPAGDTLARLYGDCKDKGTLLEAILRSDGVSAHPILVNLGERQSLSPEVPVWQFNHLVLAATLPQGTEVPARFAPALLEDSDFGRLLIVDSTDEFTSIGSLSAPLAGQPALLAAGARGKLFTLPAAECSFHRLERRLDIQALADGGLVLKSRKKTLGQLASEERGNYRTSALDHQREAERHWTRIWPDASIEGYGVEAETVEGAFVEELAVVRPAGSTRDGKGLPIFPGALLDLPRVPLGKRQSPVDYTYPRTLRYEVSVLGVPNESLLPQPRSMKGDGWEGETSYRREGDRIEAISEIRLTRTRFEPEAFPELRRFWSAVSQLESWAIDLGK